jgi:hypothetical protein
LIEREVEKPLAMQINNSNRKEKKKEEKKHPF